MVEELTGAFKENRNAFELNPTRIPDELPGPGSLLETDRLQEGVCEKV
jgi:hypothetical protein